MVNDSCNVNAAGAVSGLGSDLRAKNLMPT